MIIELDRRTLGLVKGKKFRSDAERYIEAYEDFMKSAAETGVPVAEDFTDSAMKEKIVAMGGTEANSCASISYGKLSPACVDCRTGARSKTVFYTLACNRDCFFCANRNQEEYDRYTKGMNDALAELYDSEPESGYSSIALTGGEPLLNPEKALSFFTVVSDRYPEAHKRLYTNGDLLTDEIAKHLAEAGLDEIRISIKPGVKLAGSDTLEKLSLAKCHIPYVMVEMPVLPGSVEEMKNLFRKLEEIGVDGINILEFLYPWVNADEYAAAGYRLKARPYRVLYSYSYAGGLPIAGSEEACLELLEFALKNGMRLNVHYCSLENKLTSQIYHQNAMAKLMPFEVMSPRDFFIKTARVYGSAVNRVKKQLDKSGIAGYHESEEYLEFHPCHITALTDIDEIALTSNVVEYDENGALLLRELKLDLVHPADFYYEKDI